MTQQSLLVVPATLLVVEDGDSGEDSVLCTCALVALPSEPPRYCLVCYTAQQTLCTAHLKGSNKNSLQLAAQVGGYATFRDDTGKCRGLRLSTASDWVALLANIGLSFYALAGKPTVNAVSTDFFVSSSAKKLDPGDEATVRYTAYTLAAADTSSASTLLRLGDKTHAVGDITLQGSLNDGADLYVFRSAPSSASLPSDAKGFEHATSGMIEGGVRTVVVMPAVPSFDLAVFVIQLMRVRPVHTASESILADATILSRLPSAFTTAQHSRNNGPNKATVVRADLENTASSQVATDLLAETCDPSPIGAPVAQPPSSSALVVSHSAHSVALSTLNGATMPAAAPLPSTTVTALVSAAAAEKEDLPPGPTSSLRKISMGLHAATESTQNIRHVLAATEADWRATLAFAVGSRTGPGRSSQPDMTMLSGAELAEKVAVMCAEQEQMRSKVSHSTMAVRLLEARNREMQEAIDGATKDSQELLAQRREADRAFVDMRLERDRTLHTVRAETLRTRTELEDVQRRVDAVRRLLSQSTDDLRGTRGQMAVQEEESMRVRSALESAKVALDATASKRHALEEQQAQLQQQLAATVEETRAQEAKVVAAEQAAARQRNQCRQRMESHQRDAVAQSQRLRADVVSRLEILESEHEVERARAVETQQALGTQQGRQEGAAQAMEEIAVRHAELEVAAHGAAAQVETARAELRRAVDVAGASRSALEQRVLMCQAEVQAALRQQTDLRARHSTCVSLGRPGAASSRLYDALEAVVQRVSHPVPATLVLKALEEMLERTRSADRTAADDLSGTNVDLLAFQASSWHHSRQAALARRVTWIAQELSSLHHKGVEYYYTECLGQCEADSKALTQALRALWVARDGVGVYELTMAETAARATMEKEYDAFANAVHAQKEMYAEQREALWREAETAVSEAFIEWERGMRAVWGVFDGQARSREVLCEAESAARAELECDEALEASAMTSVKAELSVRECLLVIQEESTERDFVVTGETAARQGLMNVLDGSVHLVQQAVTLKAAVMSLMEEEAGGRVRLVQAEMAGTESIAELLLNAGTFSPLCDLVQAVAQESAHDVMPPDTDTSGGGLAATCDRPPATPPSTPPHTPSFSSLMTPHAFLVATSTSKSQAQSPQPLFSEAAVPFMDAPPPLEDEAPPECGTSLESNKEEQEPPQPYDATITDATTSFVVVEHAGQSEPTARSGAMTLF